MRSCNSRTSLPSRVPLVEQSENGSQTGIEFVQLESATSTQVDARAVPVQPAEPTTFLQLHRVPKVLCKASSERGPGDRTALRER